MAESKEMEVLERYLDRRIADIKYYLEVNERSEDEKGFTPVEELNICYLAKEMLKIKSAEPNEALDKLEECAYGMKDLPKSNWIDLAENEVELDLKIMDWLETIKFELFKGKQALLKAQKQEKVLNIIIKKNVDISFLKKCSDVYAYNSSLGNSLGDFTSPNKLTEEEFELLKELGK